MKPKPNIPSVKIARMVAAIQRELVVFSPLPPVPNGIADYTYEILTLLGQKWRTSVVIDDGVTGTRAPHGVTVISLAEYEARETHYGKSLHLYQVGNNPDHVYMLQVMVRHPGLIVLHDPSLHHLLDCASVGQGNLAAYSGALESEYGLAGRTLGKQFEKYLLREQRIYFDMPMIGSLIGPALGVIVHSRYAFAKVLARVPDAEVTLVPHQYSPPARDRLRERGEVRNQLGIGDDEVVFISLGFVTKSKRIPDTLRALAAVRDLLPPFRYVIAGELRVEEVDVPSIISGLKLDGAVSVLGYVDEADFFSLIAASDVVVNLRYPIGGETSGSMIRALGGGACIVVVDKGPFAEIPDGAACKLQWGSGFEARLAGLLLRLARNPEERARIGIAAKRYIEAGNTLEATVAGYTQALERAANHAPKRWHSDVSWETLPPHQLAVVMREASTKFAGIALPLWFKSGAVLGSESPCRVVMWGGNAQAIDLIAHFGHQADARPLSCLLTSATDEDEARSIDLALVLANGEQLRGEFGFLAELNRALGFGGLLIFSIETNPGDVPHPLQMRDEGTRVFEAFGFRIDEVVVAAPPMLDCSPEQFAASPRANERCWRVVKVSEFIAHPTFNLTSTKARVTA